MTVPAHIIDEVITEVVNIFLIPKFMELGMNATGNWRESVEVKVQGNSGEIYAPKYTEQLVWGRRPNQDQSPEAIRRWAYGMANFNDEFKAWLRARGLEDYGIQIAYRIAENGTSWYQKGGSDLLEVLQTQEVADYISNRIGSYVFKSVELDLIRETEKVFA